MGRRAMNIHADTRQRFKERLADFLRTVQCIELGVDWES